MGSNKNSELVKKEFKFTLEGYGKNKKEAFGMAFGALKKKAYKEVEGLILHMEPEGVFVVEEYEKNRVEKIFGYLKPKQIQDYYVKIVVTAVVKYIPLTTGGE